MWEGGVALMASRQRRELVISWYMLDDIIIKYYPVFSVQINTNSTVFVHIASGSHQCCGFTVDMVVAETQSLSSLEAFNHPPPNAF